MSQEGKPDFYTQKGYQMRSQHALTGAMEDYLEMICRQAEADGCARIGLLAEGLNVRPSSASKMVYQLRALGLVAFEKYGLIQPTEKGWSVGRWLLHRHEVLHRFFCMLNGSTDELELVDRYIDIQSLRFEDRFTCEIDVPDRLQSCLVPKLVLQPLVENAIIHGVVDREDGYIKLQAEEQEGDLLLSVYDNGCGIPPDVLARLNSKDQKIPGEHLGLFNVSSIIRLHFGEKYGISAETTPGDGSCVRLLLPIQKKENNNA